MSLFLPEKWVYVTFKGGERINVANTDTLTREEAEKFRDQWERSRKKKVIQVELEDRQGTWALYTF